MTTDDVGATPDRDRPGRSGGSDDGASRDRASADRPGPDMASDDPAADDPVRGDPAAGDPAVGDESASGQAGGPVVAFVPDLMDRSKVSAAAGERAMFVARAADVAAAAVTARASVVVVDLARPGAVDAVADVAALDPAPTVVAFGSHVDRDVLAAAREAGADRVLARSAFFGDLAAHLS
jgi:hypothetical protein